MTGFGGPATHLRLFSKKLIKEKKWLSQVELDGLISLAALLPGPTSSQVGVAIGLEVGGLWGAFLFWFGFTLPSVVIMFGLSLISFGVLASNVTFFWGLKIAIFAVVVHSLRNLASRFAPDLFRRFLTLIALVFFLMVKNSGIAFCAIVLAAIVGIIFIKVDPKEFSITPQRLKRRMALAILVAALILMAISPYLAARRSGGLETFGNFLQIGGFAFGGGHVVLPLLQSHLLVRNLISPGVFTQGYFLAQFMPGPLFSVAAFMGSASLLSPHGLLGSAEATIGIFLPGSMLMISASHFWKTWSRNTRFLGAVAGINSAVLALLVVACINILLL
jgi:chromate transporter